MTTAKRALNADDVQCLKCGEWHHFDWGHVCPPNAKPVPILHGLTLDQLEAVRGYSETTGAIARMRVASASLAKSNPPVALVHLLPIKQGLASIRTSAVASNVTPYADGVRFAVTHAAADVESIETALQEARR